MLRMLVVPMIGRRATSLVRGIRSARLLSTTIPKSYEQKMEAEKMPMKKIRLVPRQLHEHLFGSGLNKLEYSKEEGGTADAEDEAIQRIRLPELRVRNNLMEHFHNLGAEQFQG
jgi:hypothetical protein